MDKEKVAAILDEIGILLALKGENPFRCNAYHNASRTIEQVTEDLGKLIAEGRLSKIKGIGDTLSEKITTLVTTGKLPFYDDLKKATPPGLLDMLQLPGVGPKKVKVLYEELKVADLTQLKAACESDAVAKLKGFGTKTQNKILEGLAFFGQTGKRVRLDVALGIAQRIMAGMENCKGINRMEACGSLRRRRETIADIDLLISSAHAKPIMEHFVKLEGVARVLGQGDTKSSIEIEIDRGHAIQADLRVVSDEQFPFALHYFTGSKDHNIAMRARAQQYALKLNEYELAGPKKNVKCKNEEDIFQALELDYIPPELREMTGEIEAAAAHQLPSLIGYEDLLGCFHCHTTYSDGHDTVEGMVKAAQKLGLKYFGIADHSQSLFVANGLNAERLAQQQAEIDKVAAKVKGIKLFKGTEVDILPDGRLDYDDEILNTFDYVVASVHTHFTLPEAEMTKRVIRALEHPKVTMLGHATGRLLLRRDGYKMDLEAVLKTAAKHNKMIEINAHPQRLDLDWIHCKKAKELGVTLVINPDAHSANDIGYLPFGISVARRGWLEKDNVFNTKTAAEVAQELAARRG